MRLTSTLAAVPNGPARIMGAVRLSWPVPGNVAWGRARTGRRIMTPGVGSCGQVKCIVTASVVKARKGHVRGRMCG